MSRFPTPAAYDRTHGPAPGSAGDGIHPGSVYTGTISKAPEGGEVEVTINDLSTEFDYRCRIQPKLAVSVGQQCCVIFDSQKIPWVVTGEWEESAVAGSFFQHAQVEASSEWKVLHKLKYFPGVTVFDGSSVEHIACVKHVNDEELVILFLHPTAGTAYCS